MPIKAWLKAGALPLGAVAFTALAWGLAQWVPASMRMDRWEKAATEVNLSSPVAEVCAVVQVHFGVRLTAADVAVWQRLQQQGMAADDALRTVVQYARGRVN
jgi:uncharacterized membrane protein YidH (DUF202 family)